MHKVINSFRLLKEYCENEGFKGWDPYDGLNSKVFQALPFLKKSAICRLVVIQGFKRCPVNLRWLALVPKESGEPRLSASLGFALTALYRLQ